MYINTNTTNHVINADQNHKNIPFHFHQDDHYLLKKNLCWHRYGVIGILCTTSGDVVEDNVKNLQKIKNRIAI